ncbi:MAG: M23 family metallopeptidase [Paracoccaceae bacterium]
MVEIRHPYGPVTRYGHMSKVRVEVGQKVSRGDRIGDMSLTLDRHIFTMKCACPVLP